MSKLVGPSSLDQQFTYSKTPGPGCLKMGKLTLGKCEIYLNQLWQPKGKFCLFFWSTIWWEDGLVKIEKNVRKNTFEKKKEKPELLVLKVENYILLSSFWHNFTAKNR